MILGRCFWMAVANSVSTGAEAYLRELTLSLHGLAEFPFANPVINSNDLRLRIHTHRSHIVIYRAEGARIEILRIRHAHEDWKDT